MYERARNSYIQIGDVMLESQPLVQLMVNPVPCSIKKCWTGVNEGTGNKGTIAFGEEVSQLLAKVAHDLYQNVLLAVLQSYETLQMFQLVPQQIEFLIFYRPQNVVLSCCQKHGKRQNKQIQQTSDTGLSELVTK